MSIHSRQYLAAMGIDTWELRRPPAVTENPQQQPAGVPAHVPENGRPNLQPNAQAVPGRAPVARAAGPVAIVQSTLTTLGRNLASMLLMPVTDRAGLPRRAVLVVVESPEMNQADHQLLGSMLGAIKLQPEDYQLVQTAAGADQTTGVVSCRELVAEIQPKAILVMSKLADSTVLQPLDSLRAQIHLTDWSRAQVAVTLHPRDINDNPASKRPAWEDLKRFKAALDT